MTSSSTSLLSLLCAWFAIIGHGLQISPKAATSVGQKSRPSLLRHHSRKTCDDEDTPSSVLSRRTVIGDASALVAVASAALVGFPTPARAGRPNGLNLSTAPNSGLRWADAKVGSGESPSVGSITSIDYSMASTAGRFPSIYSTKNGDAPYRWKLGDGSTIRGIELAILGDPSEGIPPMHPGGIRRVIVPNSLGYNALIGRDDANNVVLNDPDRRNLSPSAKNGRCVAGAERSLGPIPPKDAADGAYQRWYQFYCNPRIPYQPDLVLDIKLYGRRGAVASSASTPQ